MATWAGRVLSTVLIVLGFIRRTTTATGLKVTAVHFDRTYRTGIHGEAGRATVAVRERMDCDEVMVQFRSAENRRQRFIRSKHEQSRNQFREMMRPRRHEPRSGDEHAACSSATRILGRDIGQHIGVYGKQIGFRRDPLRRPGFHPILDSSQGAVVVAGFVDFPQRLAGIRLAAFVHKLRIPQCERRSFERHSSDASTRRGSPRSIRGESTPLPLPDGTARPMRRSLQASPVLPTPQARTRAAARGQAWELSEWLPPLANCCGEALQIEIRTRTTAAAVPLLRLRLRS